MKENFEVFKDFERCFVKKNLQVLRNCYRYFVKENLEDFWNFLV